MGTTHIIVKEIAESVEFGARHLLLPKKKICKFEIRLVDKWCVIIVCAFFRRWWWRIGREIIAVDIARCSINMGMVGSASSFGGWRRRRSREVFNWRRGTGRGRRPSTSAALRGWGLRKLMFRE